MHQLRYESYGLKSHERIIFFNIYMRFKLNYFEIIIHIGLYRDLLKNFEKHYQ